jgi:hypothetical protein
MAYLYPLYKTLLLDSISLRFYFINNHGISTKLPKDIILKD